MNVSEYTRLKTDIDRLAERAAKAEGAYERELSVLLEKGLDTRDGTAAEHLKDVERQAAEAGAEANTKLRTFQVKWGDKLR